MCTVQSGSRPLDKTGCNALEQANGLVGVPQEKRAGIRGDGAAIETGDNFAPRDAFKLELVAATVCQNHHFESG
ncbi:hypothetical protein AB395_00006912 (plasmid) [Sinorhizobium fredii CCBAU 45436]|nr:hypothetical protein AB395_00006912 [Sinorhizobium fredii CCBAU 45436]